MPDTVIVPPATILQEDIVAAGQRRINLLWEWTQSIIAVLVVCANLLVAVWDGVQPTHTDFPIILSSSLFLVIGFYFSRTNYASNTNGNKPYTNGRML